MDDKDVIDEIIFKTDNRRNRLMLDLMARGGMRIGKVLKLRANNVNDRKLFLSERSKDPAAYSCG
ncbi:MAG: hypothetical protein KAJ25_10320 [Desulfobacula sp.]|nr:hypothetical protein [Desulfobacula sp.]MCK5349775.1 hypothetical protein [Desulfobacula sp.]